MIRFESVTKVFPGGTKALKEVTLTFKEGEFSFVVGPSGAGKTTLLNLLIRRYVPTEGDVWYQQYHVSRLPGRFIPRLRREIGMIFQDFKLLPQLSVYENVAFSLEAVGRPGQEIKELVPYMLKLVGLEDKMNRFPHQLSSGEAQRVSIARAMVFEPKVLLADEPTGNLDPRGGWEIVELLQQINQWGTTVIMATHDRDIVDSLRHRVVRIEEGVVVEDNAVGSYD
ncbi:cell division ATP-binding protein FtsE [candidate division CPR3 bacterium 4484_211]|uniref:Cell division ATP-binding protein FtsE n=1 Tax=candidate division CPR3 bacterium 4484_211 TaxID=1968527 RepID=A0A1W9NXQ8_UNCC3|nr:MAG: cell division ATP-binding protein FtsE [candidate division CPR3 bacterium 4484_211]